MQTFPTCFGGEGKGEKRRQQHWTSGPSGQLAATDPHHHTRKAFIGGQHSPSLGVVHRAAEWRVEEAIFGDWRHITRLNFVLGLVLLADSSFMVVFFDAADGAASRGIIWYSKCFVIASRVSRHSRFSAHVRQCRENRVQACVNDCPRLVVAMILVFFACW